MSHAELQRRNQLIAIIQGVEDQSVIEEIYRLLRIGFDDSVFVTTNAQKKAISSAMLEIEEGKGIPEDEADREIEEWLGK